MSTQLPTIYLARHGETEWSRTGQHTGLTDLPLTEHGELSAGMLRRRLASLHFAHVYTSPLQRARRTCELCGFGPIAEIDPDLVEWDYGEYEGLRLAEILSRNPEWRLFRDGCPGGESPQQVFARAQRVIDRVRATSGDVLLFSSGHFLRMLAACWIGAEASVAGGLMLSTASLSALSYESTLLRPAIALWNEVDHLLASSQPGDYDKDSSLRAVT